MWLRLKCSGVNIDHLCSKQTRKFKRSRLFELTGMFLTQGKIISSVSNLLQYNAFNNEHNSPLLIVVL